MLDKTVSSCSACASVAKASKYSLSLASVLHRLSFDDNSVWFHESDSACLTSITIIEQWS
jgi:hypothetical protein